MQETDFATLIAGWSQAHGIRDPSLLFGFGLEMFPGEDRHLKIHFFTRDRTQPNGLPSVTPFGGDCVDYTTTLRSWPPTWKVEWMNPDLGGLP